MPVSVCSSEVLPPARTPEDFPEMKFGESNVNAFGEALSSSWRSGLTDDQVTALNLYREDGVDINSALRGFDPLGESVSMSDFERPTIAQIDSALAEASLSEDVTAQRCIFEAPGMTDLEPGSVFADQAYTSTSINPQFVQEEMLPMLRETAKEFDDFNDVWTLDILIPKGTHAAWIDNAGERAAKHFEILIHRGARFRVVERDDFAHRMLVEVIP